MPKSQYRVYSLSYGPRPWLPWRRDRNFEEFAARLARRMNWIHRKGWSLISVQWVADRGVVIIVHAQAAPKEDFDSPPPESSRELSDLLPAVGSLMREFITYSSATGVLMESERGKEYLAATLAQRTRNLPMEVIPQMIDNLRTVSEGHTHECQDDECRVQQLLDLMRGTLSELAKARLQ